MPAFSYNPASRDTRTEQFLAYLRRMSDATTPERAQEMIIKSIQQRIQEIERLRDGNEEEQKLAQMMQHAKQIVVGEADEKIWDSIKNIGVHSTVWTESATALDWVYAFNTDQKIVSVLRRETYKFSIASPSMKKGLVSA
ncbi:MAG: hypothetical protein CMR00_00960 [[Chlorobium] sp. 445]|nr:MAG: hypothetical protein CMR00_00960 [[Chlorobium] sp. 445]